MLYRKHRLQGGKHRAKTTHRNSHLVDSLRFARQDYRLIAEEMVEASLPKKLQGGLDSDGTVEGDRPGLDRLRYVGSPSEKPIAALGLAAHLKSNLAKFEQLERQVIQRHGVTAFEFQFDLADWLNRTAIGRTNFALVDGGLDPRRWSRRKLNRFSSDRRYEDGSQTLFPDRLWQQHAGFRRMKTRLIARDWLLPFPSCQ